MEPITNATGCPSVPHRDTLEGKATYLEKSFLTYLEADDTQRRRLSGTIKEFIKLIAQQNGIIRELEAKITLLESRGSK